MRLFTWGRINVTPLYVATSEDLTSVRDRLRAASGTDDASWGGIRLEAENESQPEPLNLKPGRPAFLRLPDGSQVLAARYLKRVPNKKLLKHLSADDADGLSDSARYTTYPVDVLAIKQNSFIILIASTDEQEVAEVFDLLKNSAGADWKIARPPKEYKAISSDFFLWLLAKWDAGSDLAPALKLVSYDQVQTSRSAGGRLSVLEGVDLNRLEVLGAVTERHDLGPATLAVRDESLKLTAELRLNLDGSFAVHRGSSFYDTPIRGHADFGLQLVRDTSTLVLPKLFSAYTKDTTWHGSGRDAFIKKAKQRLKLLVG